MNGILAATLMVGGTGLLIGILLGIAGKKFYVEVDERETMQPGTVVYRKKRG